VNKLLLNRGLSFIYRFLSSFLNQKREGGRRVRDLLLLLQLLLFCLHTSYIMNDHLCLLIGVNTGNIDTLFIASPAINIIILRLARCWWIQTSAAGFTFEASLVPFFATGANFFHCINCFGAFWAICWIRHFSNLISCLVFAWLQK